MKLNNIIVYILLSLFSSLQFTQITYAQVVDSKVIELSNRLEENFEVSVISNDGKLLNKISTLPNLKYLSINNGGNLVLYSRGTEDLYEININGNVYNKSKLKIDIPLHSIVISEDDNIFFLASDKIIYTDRLGKIIWEKNFNLGNTEITSVVKLENDSILCSFYDHNTKKNFYLNFSSSNPNSNTFIDINLDINLGEIVRFKKHYNRELFYITITNDPEIYSAKIIDKSITTTSKIYIGAYSDLISTENGLYYIREGNKIYNQNNNIEKLIYTNNYDIHNLNFLHKQNLFYIGYEKLKQESWPEYRNKNKFISNKTNLISIFLSFLTSSLFFFITFKIFKQIDKLVGSKKFKPISIFNKTLFLLAWLFKILFCILSLAFSYYLIQKHSTTFNSALLLALIINNLLLYLNVKSIKTSYKSYDLNYEIFSFTLPIITCCVATACYIYNFSSKHYNYSIGIWLANILLIIVTTIKYKSLANFTKSNILPLIIASILSSITLFYKLSEVPINFHFDFSYHVKDAVELFEDKFDSIWGFGFVPAPVISLLPEAIATKILGYNMLGIRLAPAIIGCFGVIGIYILGTLISNRFIGLLSTIFLTGNTAYMHFGRLPASIESAVACVWTLVFAVLAIQKEKIRWWALCGLFSGICFFLWPVARVAPFAVFIWVILILVYDNTRNKTKIIIGSFVLLAVFCAFISPLFSLWLMDINNLFPRANQSMTVYNNGFIWDKLYLKFGQPLIKSIQGFYGITDSSTHSHALKAFNIIESLLISYGLIIALLSRNLVCYLILITMLANIIICGAFADNPPYFTRLLSGFMLSSLLMSLAADKILELDYKYINKKLYQALIISAAIYISPIQNFTNYLKLESLDNPHYQLHEMAAIGKSISKFGDKYSYYLVGSQRSDWNVRMGSRLGELLPYVWNLNITELWDLSEHDPNAIQSNKIYILQGNRFKIDLPILKKYYKKYKLEKIYHPNKSLLAALVIVDS